MRTKSPYIYLFLIYTSYAHWQYFHCSKRTLAIIVILKNRDHRKQRGNNRRTIPCYWKLLNIESMKQFAMWFTFLLVIYPFTVKFQDISSSYISMLTDFILSIKLNPLLELFTQSQCILVTRTNSPVILINQTSFYRS